MIIANLISLILVIVGALNWGLVGIFNWNLVDAIFGGYNVGSIIVYILVCIAGLWLIASSFMGKGKITLWQNNMMNEKPINKSQNNFEE